MSASEVIEALQHSPLLLRCLHHVHSLGLPQAYVAAGLVRSAYWAACHGRKLGDEFQDVDVVFFDRDSPLARDAALAALLCERESALHWEVTNQAHIHTWYESYTGVALTPRESVADGIALWPETATCIAVRLGENGGIELLAPCGLHDLIALRWRANPRCPDASAFARRLASKRVAEHWPRVQIVV